MWTTEWPTEPGPYWFYGKYNSEDDSGYKLLFTRAHRVSNGVSCVAGGHFVYRSEMTGWWMPAILPEPPEIT